jgi:hypothetical protein
MKKTKIKVGISLLFVVSGLFCLVKLNIINFEDFTFLSWQSAPTQTIQGDQSSAFNVQNSPNANISVTNVTEKPTLAIDKVKLSERYPYEFDNYLGSTGEAGYIEQNTILRKHYTLNNRVRITPVIANLNEGIPFKQARIQLIFDQDIVIEDYRGWVEQEVNSRYSFKFGEPINNVPLNTSNSIFVSFPEPRRYRIKALIDGEYLKGVKEVNYFIESYE